MNLGTTDLVVFFGYIIFMMGFGVWIANRDKNENASDYFLASRSLPWWAVGGSLIASNISTEQIMGMNGSGYVLGMAIATYELMAAITLIIVAKYFLPIFLKKGIYTMPQFLEERYNGTVRSIMSIFWVALFIFVNISSVLFLGGLAIQELMGVPLLVGIIGLVVYSAAFSIFGGLKAVVWTDVIQVVVLVIGGVVASYLVLSAVGGGFFSGIEALFAKTPERFEMIFETDDTFTNIETGATESAYALLPGLTVLFGGMWITNLYYWGNNQYIIQRALAAKDIKEAQKGVAFAAFLKIFMPIIVVLPGIAAFVLGADIPKADAAFPWVLSNYVTIGLKGLVFAALVAAIGSSISSIVNSTSTIFTLDIYKQQIDKAASELKLVRVGRIVAAISLVIGAIVAPLLGSLGQVFQYIQEYTGFVSPGVFALFIFGMFWKRTTSNAALLTVIVAIPFSIVMKFGLPDLPFLDRMAIAFLLCSLTLVVVSLLDTPKADTIAMSDGVIGKADDLKMQGEQALTTPAFRWGLMGSVMLIGGFTGVKILTEDVGVGAWLGFVVLLLVSVVVALAVGERKPNDPKALYVDSRLFKTEAIFNISAFAVLLILAAIYTFLG